MEQFEFGYTIKKHVCTQYGTNSVFVTRVLGCRVVSTVTVGDELVVGRVWETFASPAVVRY